MNRFVCRVSRAITKMTTLTQQPIAHQQPAYSPTIHPQQPIAHQQPAYSPTIHLQQPNNTRPPIEHVLIERSPLNQHQNIEEETKDDNKTTTPDDIT
mgnify:CR=1 FL=1